MTNEEMQKKIQDPHVLHRVHPMGERHFVHFEAQEINGKTVLVLSKSKFRIIASEHLYILEEL